MPLNKTTQRNGYVIVRYKDSTTGFTASSSYDRPAWVKLSESTVYPTAEFATAAVKKLWNNGAYSAAVKSLTEFTDIELDIPSDDEVQMSDPNAPSSDTEMVADKQGEADDDNMAGVCPECDCDPCECDNEPAAGDNELNLDSEVPGEDVGAASNGESEFEFDSRPNEENEETARLHPRELEMLKHTGKAYRTRVTHNGKTGKPVSENATMPGKPATDAQPAENNTTAASTPFEVKTVEFKDDPAAETVDMSSGNGADTITVPSELKRQLTRTIAELRELSDDTDRVDDNTSSQALTTADALQQLLDDLSLGTVAGIKQAQVHMTSFMSPITNKIPADVIKFISRGGQRQSLKDIFGTKWDSMRSEK